MDAVKSVVVSVAGIGALTAMAYKGAQYILGDPNEALVHCNRNIQAFELDQTPIYWRMFEGRCYGSDINFDRIRVNIEYQLNQDPSNWPKAFCNYAHANGDGYVWAFGTDYYEVEEIDCIQPLKDLQEEKEKNTTIGDVVKNLITDQRTDISGIIANFM